MYTDDAYFESEEFREILQRYQDTPNMLDADDLTEVADYYLSMGDDEKSDEAIQLALKLFPTASAPLAFKVRGALEECDIEGAERLFSLIDEKDDDYLLLLGELHVAKEEDKEAEAVFSQLWERCRQGNAFIEPEEFLLEVASIHINYSLYEQAAAWLDKSKDTDAPDYIELRARSFIGMGKPEEAIPLANKLIDLNPFSKRSWHILGSAQYLKGEYEEAISCCDYALAVDHAFSPALYLKANCLFDTGEFEAAVACYQESRKADKADSWLYLNEGTCQLHLENYQEAFDLLTKAEELAHTDGGPLNKIYRELAFALGSQERADEAMEMLDKITDDDDRAETLILRGHLQLQKNDIEEATMSFLTMLQETGFDPSTIVRVGATYYDNMNFETAYFFFKLMEKKCEGSDFNEGFSLMALCCKHLGWKEEFLRCLKKACEVNPREADAMLGQYFPEGMKPEQYYNFAMQLLENDHTIKPGKTKSGKKKETD